MVKFLQNSIFWHIHYLCGVRYSVFKNGFKTFDLIMSMKFHLLDHSTGPVLTVHMLGLKSKLVKDLGLGLIGVRGLC